MPLPREIYSVEAVRGIDRAAIDGAGIAGYTLMTRAGQVAFEQARNRWPEAGRWHVICGSGNNAGDGYVVARLAAEQGIAASVLALKPPESLTGDAQKAYMDFAAMGGAVAEFTGQLDGTAQLFVDAILGSGLDRDLDGEYAAVVRLLNARQAPVLALDIPSGLHGDTGLVLGVAVQAQLTVTFVGLKPGLFLGEAPFYVGDIAFADLDIPAACRSDVAPVLQRIDNALVAEHLPRRPRHAHKGDFGRVLVVGGNEGMPGAVTICGLAALRAGAGAVTIATHPAHCGSIPAANPELMCRGVANGEALAEMLASADVVAVGPGLGTSDWSRELLAAVLAHAKLLVVDADALNLLPGLEVRGKDWVLTPHPGEAGRLLGRTTAEIQADRVAALRGIAEDYGGSVVLKGAGSLVSSGSGVPWLCTAGNPGMAAPGMGDALTGVIAALLAQGLSPEAAAAVAVQIHATAGDNAAGQGERGLLATDLLQHIRVLVNP